MEKSQRDEGVQAGGYALQAGRAEAAESVSWSAVDLAQVLVRHHEVVRHPTTVDLTGLRVSNADLAMCTHSHGRHTLHGTYT